MSFMEEGKIRIKTLLVDDNQDMLEIAKKFFEKNRPEIDLDVSSSAKQALDLVEEKAYDAIVSDYQMPVMDGLEFLDEVRSRGIDVPFIFLTGQGEEDVAMEAVNLGADKYYKKGAGFSESFDELADSIVEEAKRAKSEEELKTFQRWIKGSLESEEDEERLF